MTISECYIVLEIAPTQDTRRIRSQYLRLAKKWHPDVNSDNAAQRKFQDIQLAYNTLTKAIESGTINYQSTTSNRSTTTSTTTKVDPRAQAQARRQKAKEERERIRNQRIEILAKKHMAQYIEMLSKKNYLKNLTLFYIIATLGTIYTLIVLSGIVISFYLSGMFGILISLAILMFSCLPLYYYLIFITEFYFLIKKSKPTVRFHI